MVDLLLVKKSALCWNGLFIKFMVPKFNKKHVYDMAFVVLGLTACQVGPDLHLPSLALPKVVRGDDGVGHSFGEQDWKKVFREPDLRRLIERALAQNVDLVAATYRIEEARAQAGVARARWFPSLDGSTSGSSNYGSIEGGQVGVNGKRSSDSYDVLGMMSWELDMWGGIQRSQQAARERLLASEYQCAGVKTSLIAAVATAYADLVNLDERLEISKRTIESRKASLELVRLRRDGGVSSDLEFGQAEALLDQATVSIPVTERSIVAKENELKILLGDMPGGVKRESGVTNIESSFKIKAGLPVLLLERRPDVLAAGHLYQAALAEIGVAQAARLPSVSLTGTGGVMSGDFSRLLTGDAVLFSVGPRLTGPIWDAGRRKYGVKAAEARASQAKEQYRGVVQVALREVANALNAYQKSIEIIDARARFVNSLGRVKRVASERFQGGASSYLEVLDAERSLFNAELELADAKRDRVLAVVQSYRALGGGWK